MSPEDIELWTQFTQGILPLVVKPVAPVVRPAHRAAPRRSTFSPTLDLHGLTVALAHAETKRLVRDSMIYGLRFVTVITGLSGPIRHEFPLWTETMPEVKRVEPLNGGGAFKVHLVRKPRLT